MANDVNHLIDMLYTMIDEAKSAAFGQGKCTINRDEALDLLDEVRAQLPIELKRAQELLRARDEYVEAAKRDVERMMRQADLEAKSKVSDSEVLYAAKEKARKIIADAEDRSRQLCQVANEYAEDALARGCAAPHRGGHHHGPGGDPSVPGQFPGRLCGEDAAAKGDAPGAEKVAGGCGEKLTKILLLSCGK